MQGDPEKATSGQELIYALESLNESMHKFCIFVDSFETCLKKAGILTKKDGNL